MTSDLVQFSGDLAFLTQKILTSHKKYDNIDESYMLEIQCLQTEFNNYNFFCKLIDDL